MARRALVMRVSILSCSFQIYCKIVFCSFIVGKAIFLELVIDKGIRERVEPVAKNPAVASAPPDGVRRCEPAEARRCELQAGSTNPGAQAEGKE